MFRAMAFWRTALLFIQTFGPVPANG